MLVSLAIGCARPPIAPQLPSPEPNLESEPEPEDDDEDEPEPSPAAEHQDWREARAALIRGSPHPPETVTYEHALYSLLPDNPTPEQVQHEGADYCARVCAEPYKPHRLSVGFEPPMQIAWSSTSPLVITFGTPTDDIRNEPILFTKIHAIDAEALVSQCLYRLGRDPSLTYERACTREEQAEARSRRKPPP